jgi:hypothetical protein
MSFSMRALAVEPTRCTGPDLTEGGSLETDHGVPFLAEWWYLNANATLVADDGERRRLGFLVTVGHQESALINQMVGVPGPQLSHVLNFRGLFPQGETPQLSYEEAFVPQATVGSYIALNTPYLAFTAPSGNARASGSGMLGYRFFHSTPEAVIDVFFRPDAVETVDQADAPLRFTTYERAHGSVHGTVVLNGKRYWILQAEGYFDHMIPVGDYPWPMYMHGWVWSEVTTDRHQAILYAVRSLEDGYARYSFKHLTLLDKGSGRVVGSYSGDQVSITETQWVDEQSQARKRPASFVVTTPDLTMTMGAESVAYFVRPLPGNSGFVDFMSFQPDQASLQYRGYKLEWGSSFVEYLVSDLGALMTPP